MSESAIFSHEILKNKQRSRGLRSLAFIWTLVVPHVGGH
jgi:hypothetical protein